MRIRVHRHTDVTVPQDFLYHFGMRSPAEQDGRRAVPQVVKAYVWQASFFQDAVQCAAQGRQGEVVALGSGEH